MNPRQKAHRKIETHPMKTEDFNRSLLQNSINPKMLQESLILGKAKERMTCFPMERNGNHLFSYNKRITRNPEHTQYQRNFTKGNTQELH